MVYKYKYSPTDDLVGYIDASLSVFNTSHYTADMGSDDDDPDPDVCQYRGYRNGPEHPTDPYGLSPQYWHVFAARLAFVVVFEVGRAQQSARWVGSPGCSSVGGTAYLQGAVRQRVSRQPAWALNLKAVTPSQHIVFLTTAVVSYIIPDVPTEVRTQIQRERLLTKEAKFDHGLSRGKSIDEYDELLYALRERDLGNNSRFGDILRRGSWGRRLSRQSDGAAGDSHTDMHRTVTRSSSTVWGDPSSTFLAHP